jgi:ribonuclease HII
MRDKSHSLFLYDEYLRTKHPIVAGLDEAGRGPLAGPVVAAAVVLPAGLVIEGLRDSKEVSKDERQRLFWKIVCNAVDIGVGIIEADIIDKINILKSTILAMERAVKDLSIKPSILLIDTVNLPSSEIIQRSIIKGESISASIAAASIVAKVVRDDIMTDYHEKYPLYNFKKHKGYSTKEHIESLRLYGPCPIHRKSFKKVMELQLPLNP